MQDTVANLGYPGRELVPDLIRYPGQANSNYFLHSLRDLLAKKQAKTNS